MVSGGRGTERSHLACEATTRPETANRICWIQIRFDHDLSNLDEVHEGVDERDYSLGRDVPDSVVDELRVGAVQDGEQDVLVATVQTLEREREGEVVLAEGEVTLTTISSSLAASTVSVGNSSLATFLTLRMSQISSALPLGRTTLPS